MQRRTQLHVRKSFGYLILSLTAVLGGCYEADSPVAPDPSAEATDLSNVRHQGFKDRLVRKQGQCVLRATKRDGEFRYTRRAIKFPRTSEHPQGVTRKFIYVSRATPGADPVRFAVCDIPATEAAIAYMQRLVQRMNRNAKVVGRRAGEGVWGSNMVRTDASAPTASVSASGISQQNVPSFVLESTGSCVEGGVCTLDPIVVIGTPSGEECDPYLELDWECECDGPGVDPNLAPESCNEWDNNDDGDGGGGIDGSEGGELLPPTDGESPVESIDDLQGANKYGCVGNVEYPQRSFSNPANVDVSATTVCAVALPELYVHVTLSVRKVIMRVGYWDEIASGSPVALTFVREVRTTASGPCVPGQYRAESEHHATGLEGEYLGSPRNPWRIMTVTCNG